MPNEILKLLLKSKEERGLLGELRLDLYEAELLQEPFALYKYGTFSTPWSKFVKLRKLFGSF